MIFKTPGRQNTEETAKLAVQQARENGIDTIILSSNSGESVDALLKEDVAGLKIICITQVNGSRAGGVQDLEERRAALKEKGVTLLTATHLLSGVERAMSTKFGGVYPTEIIAHTLRMFGQGTKVCVEIAAMALDAGLIEYLQPVVALGGSGRGLDTAIILRPAYGNSIFDTKIDRYICKPIP
jgi:hypothetical protein